MDESSEAILGDSELDVLVAVLALVLAHVPHCKQCVRIRQWGRDVIVDLFAGPGGWSQALRNLGEAEVGIEWDDAACATRAAAGHLTVRADVANYPPEPFAGLAGMIASPPCQAFSRLGKRGGKDDAAALRTHILASTREWKIPAPPEEWADSRSALVLEPLRWAHALLPPWILLEQVPPVLPLWQTMSVALGELGYKTWVGKIDAADYGTPQHRLRAVLLARRGKAPAPPLRSHGGSRPFVTMAEALEWREGESYPRNDQSGTSVDLAWPWKRPASTIAGRLLACDPGSNANRFNGSTKSRNDGYRLTEAEAGILQGFPRRYPWSGPAGKRPEQIGNAVPVQLAQRLIEGIAA